MILPLGVAFRLGWERTKSVSAVSGILRQIDLDGEDSRAELDGRSQLQMHR